VAVGFVAEVGFALCLIVKGYLQRNPDCNVIASR
jgi:hypothetical protein